LANKFIVSLDHKELEWRFPNDIFWPDFAREGLADYRIPQKEKLLLIIEKLPKREKDIINLYYIVGKDQRDIGQILSITQGDVSYRLKRAIKRMKFLLKLPDLSEDVMRTKLGEVLPNEQYVEIMIGIYKTSSQSAVAKKIGLSQGKIRYRFLRGLEIIRKLSTEQELFKQYHETFKMISQNFNILRELEAQQRWAPKFQDSIVA